MLLNTGSHGLFSLVRSLFFALPLQNCCLGSHRLYRALIQSVKGFVENPLSIFTFNKLLLLFTFGVFILRIYFPKWFNILVIVCVCFNFFAVCQYVFMSLNEYRFVTTFKNLNGFHLHSFLLQFKSVKVLLLLSNLLRMEWAVAASLTMTPRHRYGSVKGAPTLIPRARYSYKIEQAYNYMYVHDTDRTS